MPRSIFVSKRTCFRQQQVTAEQPATCTNESEPIRQRLHEPFEWYDDRDK